MTTEHPTADIVVVGSINADLTVTVARHPSPGETLLGGGGGITAGGKGANQAVAAALQGASVAMVAAVGKDPYAEPATEHLRSSGVDMSSVAEVDETTGLAVITVSEDGENNIVVVPGANATVDAAYVESRASISSPAPGSSCCRVKSPRTASLRQSAWPPEAVVVNLAPVIEVDRASLLKADPIMANEHEAGLILEQLGAGIPSEEPTDLAQALLDAGFPSVVLTLGGAGALVADASGVTPIATPSVSSVDSTGAGDAFAGALRRPSRHR
ncbi:PfkB family carbohydrate kinase [Corynebacterium suedekumii]|nr:PfkB family carbohydrate kinase [Corynebacterium suedekumii]